ncbi:hypothetical protein R3P38DRAFT_3239593 [Favolaschia claudopus]|uniref:F-box domain-containing protein n=1 Tax=Favolaschia claudopus TaxID=2862362 RepID=A0AAV9Z8F6_9AGAR
MSSLPHISDSPTTASVYEAAEFPPEIEENIFLHALEGFVDSVRYDIERIAFMGVCRRWSRVIGRCPVIWSNVVIHPYMSLERIRFILYKVPADSLEVRFVLDTDARLGSRAAPPADYMHQWAYHTAPLLAEVATLSTELILHTLTHELVAILLKKIGFARACDVHTLSCISRETEHDFVAGLHPAFGRRGSLRVLTVRGVVPTWNMTEVYTSLTALYMSNIGHPFRRDHIRTLLASSPNLGVLEMSNVLFQTRYYEDEVVDLSDIVIPRLTSLKLGFGLDPHLNIPTSLVTPVLDALHLQSHPTRSWTEIGGLCGPYLGVARIFSMKQTLVDFAALDCIRRLDVGAHIDIGRCPASFIEAVAESVVLHIPCRREWIVPPHTLPTVLAKFWASASSQIVVYELLDAEENDGFRYRRWDNGSSSYLVHRTDMGC